MEFLRFGSSIPGSYWGCCAIDIIQNFNVNPNDPASIELVDGDAGCPTLKDGSPVFAGKTYKEVFQTRLRIGTFSSKELPNHAFFAVLTETQVSGGYGKEWLKILYDEGFEFLRTIDNSVYSGPTLHIDNSVSSHPNHVFALFRNIGAGQIKNPYIPPKEWLKLAPKLALTPSKLRTLEKKIEKETADQLKKYQNLPPLTFYSKEELEAASVPITRAGKRSKFPQESEAARKTKDKANQPGAKAKDSSIVSPF